MLIRDAELEDADGIAKVHVLSWQAAYRGLLPQDYLDGLEPAQRRSVWLRTISGQGGREKTLVVDHAGTVMGFAHVCPSHDASPGHIDGSSSGTVGELASIYVLPSVWGQGYGQGLMAAAVSALKEADFEVATLWVLEGNRRARKFYEAGGWETDGTTKQETLRGFVMDEVRYRLALAGSGTV